MATLPFNVEEITSAQLDALIAAESPEGMTLEFKSEAYRPDHDGKREFLKDVTSFANTSGGYLLIGMAEDGGIATEICPLTTPDADTMKQRLESLLQSAVEPRIFGIRMHAIAVSGGYVMALRVPRSSTAPHRVTAQNSNRFYLRSSAGAYEASMEQLRSLFSETGDVKERLLKFHHERINAVKGGQGAFPLVARGLAVVHIVPLSAQTGTQPIHMGRVAERQTAFRPMGASMGHSARFNVDGYVIWSGAPECEAYTQVFRNGTVESVYLDVVREFDKDQWLLPARSFQDFLFEGVARIFDGLQTLEVNPPFFVVVSILGTDRAIVICERRMPAWRSDYSSPLKNAVIELPICVIGDFGSVADYQAHLKPALDALWNAGNRSEWQPG